MPKKYTFDNSVGFALEFPGKFKPGDRVTVINPDNVDCMRVGTVVKPDVLGWYIVRFKNEDSFDVLAEYELELVKE